MVMSNKIAAPNWRWRFQFEHRWFHSSVGCIRCSLSAPAGELFRSA
jgi:hypothetical protein